MNNIIKKVIGFLCILSCLLVAIGCDMSMLNLSGGDAEGHEHHFIHVDAKAATCLTDGNIEYFQCTTCDKYYDISQIKEVTKEETIIKALGHNLVHVNGIEASCEREGVREHYYCSNCNKNFEDENGIIEITDVSISAGSHNLVFVDGKQPTESENGCLPHYHCEICGRDFEDANAIIELTNVILTSTGHSLGFVPAKTPTCTEEGNVGYYHCEECGKNFEDSKGTILLENVTIPATGHTFTKVEKVDATCESEGTLEHYHCEVCGKDYADIKGEVELNNTVVAICGHTLEKSDGVLASCLFDGVLAHYHCTVCNKDFLDAEGRIELTSLIVTALGHKAVKVDAKESTCSSEGCIEHYHCENCGKDFEDEACTKEINNVAIAKLAHDPGEAVIENETPSTCELGASYDEVIRCKVCGEEISRTTITSNPSGHSFETKTISVENNDKVNNIKLQVCSNCGRVEYWQFVNNYSFGEEVYHSESDSEGKWHECYDRTDEVNHLSYTLDRSYKYENCMGYQITKLIIKSNNELVYESSSYIEGYWEAHNFDLTISYTNQELGCDGGWSRLYKCQTCGYERVETGFGHLVNGWSGYDVWDETFGSIAGFQFRNCDICNKKISIKEFHNYQPSEVNNEYVIEKDGKTYTGLFEKFNEKNMELYLVSYEEMEGCTAHVHYLYGVKADNFGTNDFNIDIDAEKHDYEVVVSYDNPALGCDGGYQIVKTCKTCGHKIEVSSSGHKWIDEQIQLNQYGNCDGWINYRYCEVCNNYEYINVYVPNANYTTTYEDYTDDEGNYHNVTKRVIEEIGLTYNTDYYSTNIDDCYSSTNRKYVVEFGELKFEKTRVYKQQHHPFEYTYKLLGETCDDGYEVYAKCPICGYEERYTTMGHRFEQKRFELTNDNGDVYFFIQYNTCVGCNYCSHAWYSVDCNYNFDVSEYEEDGILYHVEQYVNEEYNFEFINTWYEGPVENCHYKCYRTYTVIQNSETVFEINYYDNYESHNFEYVNEFLGETQDCESGVHYVATCKDCGRVEERTRYGHYTRSEDIYLSQYGDYSGYIHIGKCDVCGKIVDLSLVNMHYNEINETYRSETDENGVVHGIWEAQATNKDLSYTIDTYTVEINGCRYTNKVTITLQAGEYNFEGEKYEYEYRHDIERTAVMLGETCEDGYKVIEKCRNCDYQYEYTTYGHQYERETYEITDENGNWVFRVYADKCIGCGDACNVWTNDNGDFWSTLKSESLDYEEDGKHYQGTHYISEKYDLDYTRVWYEGEKEGCYYDRYNTLTVKHGSDDAVVYSYKDRYESHDYEYVFDPVEEGYDCNNGVHYTRICKNCGLSYEGTRHGHYSKREEIDLSQYGDIVGYLYYNQCQICGQCTYMDVDLSGNDIRYLSEDVTDENAIVHHVEKRYLEDNSLVYIVDYYYETIDMCHRKRISTSTLEIGEYKFECVRTYNEDSHDIERTIEMLGTTCEDGYKVIEKCKNCDYQSEYTTYGHQYYQDVYEVSDENGDWVFRVYSDKCIGCGDTRNVWKDINGNFWNGVKSESLDYEEDGKHYQGEHYTSEKYDLDYTRVWYDGEKEGCYINRYFTLTIKHGSDELVYSYKNTYDAHDFEYVAEFSSDDHDCEKGVHVIRTCKTCGMVNEYDNRWHESTRTNVDLSQYGAFNGHVYYDVCDICGKYTYIDVSIEDEHTETYEPHIDPNGKQFDIWKITTNNGLIYTRMTGREQIDDCNYEDTVVYTVNAGEYNFYGVRTNRYSNHQFEYTYSNLGATCEEGYDVHGKCTKCGYEEDYRSSGHRCIYENTNFSDNGNIYIQLGYSKCILCEMISEVNPYFSDDFLNNSVYESLKREENGRHYNGYKYTSEKYGVEFVYEWYSDNAQNDYYNINYIVTLKKANEVLFNSTYEVQRYLYDSYYVWFETNGGTYVPEQRVTALEKLSKPEDPTRDGYVFKGWYYNNVEWNFDEDVVIDSVTLRAKWAPITYKLSYYENGVLLEECDVYYGKEIILGASSDDYYYVFLDEFEGHQDGDRIWWSYREDKIINVNRVYDPLAKFIYELNTVNKTIKINRLRHQAETVELQSEYTINGEVYTLTELGNDLFWNHYELTSVYIPASVISIDGYLFRYSSVTRVVVDSNNPVYDSRDNCNAIIETATNKLIDTCRGTIIPSSVTTIGSNCFFQSDLESIIIPEGVTTIESYAFNNCYQLKSFNVPASVTSIGTNILRACDQLASITVDPNNPVYDSRDNCNAIIETATNKLIKGCNGSFIPDGIVEIAEGAFDHVGGIKNITIPDSVTKVGNNAFWNIYGTETLVIGANLVEMGYNAFYGTSLVSIIVDPNNPKYDSRNDCNAIIETATNTLLYGSKNTVIPNDVTTIGPHVFMDHYNIENFVIPEGVSSIKQAAFMSCWNMKSIVIPSTITFIGLQAFDNCGQLETVYFTGTEEQWNAIDIKEYNGYLTNANIVFNYNPNN